MLRVVLLGIADSLCKNSCSYVKMLMIVQVCLHFARKLLRERAKWPVHAFMQAWQSSTPEVCPYGFVIMLHLCRPQEGQAWGLIQPDDASCDASLPGHAAPRISCAYCVPGTVRIHASIKAVNPCI